MGGGGYKYSLEYKLGKHATENSESELEYAGKLCGRRTLKTTVERVKQRALENQLKVQVNEILRHVFQFLQNSINPKDLLLYNLSNTVLLYTVGSPRRPEPTSLGGGNAPLNGQQTATKRQRRRMMTSDTQQREASVQLIDRTLVLFKQGKFCYFVS